MHLVRLPLVFLFRFHGNIPQLHNCSYITAIKLKHYFILKLIKRSLHTINDSVGGIRLQIPKLTNDIVGKHVYTQ